MTTKTGCLFSANWNEKVDKDGRAVLSLTTLHAEHNHPVGPGQSVPPHKNPLYQGKPSGTKRKVTTKKGRAEPADVKVSQKQQSTDVKASRKQPERTAKKQKLEKEE